jgi:NADH dehydrogenase/NADH:ubiquinone oxidoreductase subunit G
MPTLTIDTKSVTVPDGTTILEASARKAGVMIPTLCFLENVHAPHRRVPGLRGRGGGRARSLVASCVATRSPKGMKVQTNSPRGSREARRTVVELLLSDHERRLPDVRPQR